MNLNDIYIVCHLNFKTLLFFKKDKKKKKKKKKKSKKKKNKKHSEDSELESNSDGKTILSLLYEFKMHSSLFLELYYQRYLIIIILLLMFYLFFNFQKKK